MKYELQFLSQAVSDLERLDRVVAQRIYIKLRWLAVNFEATRPQALTGPLAGLFKLRFGNYRAIYEVDREHRLLIVHIVGHRREVYQEP